MLEIFGVDGYIEDDINKFVELVVFSGFVDVIIFEEVKILEDLIKKFDKEKFVLVIELGKVEDVKDILRI